MSTNNNFEEKLNHENECCCNSQCDCEEGVSQNSDNIENTQENQPEMSNEQMEAIKAFNEHLQGLNDQIDEAKSSAEKEKQRADEYAKKLISLQSEFDNFRRRNTESVKAAREDGSADVLIEVINILDVIEQALSMIKDNATADGIKMIYRQIENVLKNFGVQEIPALDMDFDPNVHNAVEKAKVDGAKSGKVIEVISKGYQLGDKILRYSSVKIAE